MAASPSATCSLEILVLGELRVRRDGRPLPLPPSRKTRALLGYLALSGRPQTRERLCDLLWDGPGDPRAALRWSLTKLRPLVDGDRRRLVADRDSVAVELGEGELDLAAARDLLQEGAARAPLEALRRAASLFRGELLEGLDVADCFGFHEWCVAQRDAARRLRLAVLDALVANLEDAEPEEALASARARVAVDPFAEAGHLAVVRLLARLRRAREGLEQYDAWRAILASSSGGRPSPEMERARLSLTAPAASPGAPAPAPAAPPLAAPERAAPGGPAAPPLVGRGRERSAIADAVAAVAHGRRCRVVLVLGEPGIGKSRLLDETAAEAARAGFLALRSRAFEAETLRPYGPWVDALRTAPLATLPEVQRAELAPLVPELGAVHPSTDQARLFDGVVRAVGTLAGAAPVLVAIDDVQWLDDASAALLHYASRALEGAPVLLACAARPGELADNPAALRTVRSLGRGDAVVRLELENLREDEIAELAGRVAPSVDPSRVYAESEGNPLFALLVAGALRGGAEAWASLDTLVADRLAAVSGAAREVLSWAAALGRGFRADLLAHVSGVGPAELLAALASLERHGVVRPSGDAAWDFAHDLFRQAAYGAISEPRRKLLHRAIARALATLPDAGGALAGEVARHAALGDDADLAAHSAIAAGARALRVFAVAEAKEIVERGLRFVDRLPAPRRIPVALALLRVLVDASRPLGGDPELLPRIQGLIEEARQEAMPAEIAVGYSILSHAHFANRDLAHTAEATDDAMEALRGVAPAAAASPMAETGGCLALLERDLVRARMLLDEARRCPADLTRRAAVYVEGGTGILQDLDGAPEKALVTLERAVRLAREDAPWEECPLLARLAFLDLELGHPERVAPRAERIRVVAPHLGDDGATLLADALELVASRTEGAPVSERDLEVAFSRVEEDAKAHFARLACFVAEQDLAAGRYGAAHARLERACVAAERVSRPSGVVLARALLAMCELACGDASAARSHLDAARREIDPGIPLGRGLGVLEAVASRMGTHATPLAQPHQA